MTVDTEGYEEAFEDVNMFSDFKIDRRP